MKFCRLYPFEGLQEACPRATLFWVVMETVPPNRFWVVQARFSALSVGARKIACHVIPHKEFVNKAPLLSCNCELYGITVWLRIGMRRWDLSRWELLQITTFQGRPCHPEVEQQNWRNSPDLQVSGGCLPYGYVMVPDQCSWQAGQFRTVRSGYYWW